MQPRLTSWITPLLVLAVLVVGGVVMFMLLDKKNQPPATLKPLTPPASNVMGGGSGHPAQDPEIKTTPFKTPASKKIPKPAPTTRPTPPKNRFVRRMRESFQDLQDYLKQATRRTATVPTVEGTVVFSEREYAGRFPGETLWYLRPEDQERALKAFKARVIKNLKVHIKTEAERQELKEELDILAKAWKIRAKLNAQAAFADDLASNKDLPEMDHKHWVELRDEIIGELQATMQLKNNILRVLVKRWWRDPTLQAHHR